MAVTNSMKGVALWEPVTARGHRVLAHLCAEFERALVTGCMAAWAALEP